MSVLGEILFFAAVGVIAAAVIEIWRQYLGEYKNWRRCAGRSAFWPLIH